MRKVKLMSVIFYNNVISDLLKTFPDICYMQGLC